MKEKPRIHLLQVGQIFKNFAGLYRFLTGKEPPSGKRNQDAVKNQFKKYFEWKLLKDIDSQTTSKRAIIITKIYDSPITLPENRGKRGKYSDLLKPLLLMHGQFQGKESELFRELNILGRAYENRYKEYLPNEPWRNSNSIDLLPWRIAKQEGRPLELGEYTYRRVLWNDMRMTVERALDSLQQEGKISWRRYYVMIPTTLKDMEGTKERRPKTVADLKKENCERSEFLETISEDSNCVLDIQKLNALDIYSAEWQGSVDLEEYQRLMFLDAKSRGENASLSDIPIKATEEQEEILKHIELFVRQYTYKVYKKMKKFPSIEDVPKEYEFFSDRKLGQLYRDNVKELYPLLIRCRAIWKEIEYVVLEEPNTTDYPPQNILSDKLSIQFLQRMDTHMKKYRISLRGGDLLDIGDDKAREKLTGQGKKDLKRMSLGLQCSLGQTRSAQNFHELLCGLYPEKDVVAVSDYCN